jgi:UPF0271 protein
MDLNADLGEGFGSWTAGDDEGLLAVITSANVACGFHAGDPVIMGRVCRQAVEHGVAIGAQVGYRDLAGFGRRRMEVARAELAADVLYQLGALEGFAAAAGDRVRYLKPHGALYHATLTDAEQAAAVIDALAAWHRPLPVLTQPGSELARQAAAAGLAAVSEAFADRGYRADGSLQPRQEPGAVLHELDLISERAARLASAGTLVAVDGSELRVRAASLCVHGDTPGAVAIAQAVRAALERDGVEVVRFA